MLKVGEIPSLVKRTPQFLQVVCEELPSYILLLHLYMKVNFTNPTSGLINFHHGHNVKKKNGNTKTA
jgi:hypothetical protein